MADDAQLLRSYVEARSEAAFAELVQRHVGLVYHAALRQLGPEKQLAEDVVQAVFILLAEKSPGLLAHPSLAGWLHTATHFKVGHALRAERRRLLREDRAAAMNALEREAAAAEWERIRPVLDQVLQELDARDREAVLLRFFENQPFAEIAARLRLTEAAAHKRVERALEKLRARLARRGVTSTAAALTGLLGAQTALAAPAGLANAVTSAVVATGLPVAAAGGLAFMSTKTSVAVAAAAALLLSGVATYEVRARRDALAAVAAVERDTAALQASWQREQERIARERAAAATPPPVPAPTPLPAGAPRPTVGLSMTDRRAEGRAFLKAHPEMRAALVSYYRVTIREEYADLIAAMKLSAAETDRFVEIMMNGSGRGVGQHLFMLSEADDPAGEFARELKELLGEQRYEQYREANRLAPARSLADGLVAALYYTPTPLTPPQIEQFKGVVLQTLDDPSLGPRYSGSVYQYIPAPVWAALKERAPTVLSPPQMAALEDQRLQAAFFQAQTEARRAYDKK